jgi:hypothetical protein
MTALGLARRYYLWLAACFVAWAAVTAHRFTQVMFSVAGGPQVCNTGRSESGSRETSPAFLWRCEMIPREYYPWLSKSHIAKANASEISQAARGRP